MRILTLRTMTAMATAGVLAGCSAKLSPMIDYAALQSQRHPEFFAHGDTLALRATNPSGQNLVLDEPRLDHDCVVLVAGVVSGGAAGLRTYCFKLAGLPVQPDWPDRVYWRNRDGALVPVRDIDRSDTARQVVANCR